MRKEWCLARLARCELPYIAYILDHYVGEIISLEELGKLTNDTVEKICNALGIRGTEDYIILNYKDILRTPLEDIQGNDRELIEKIIDKIDDNASIIIYKC